MRLAFWLITVFIAITSTHGQSTWLNTYGTNGSDEFFDVVALQDSGFVAVGSTGILNGGDMYVLKVDKNGQIVWSTTLGSPFVEEGTSIDTTSNGIVVAGTELTPDSAYDVKMVFLDHNGEYLSHFHYGSSDWDFNRSLQSLSDGFLLSGSSFRNGSEHFWVFKTDLNGVLLWEYLEGMPGSNFRANAAVELAGGMGYVAAGYEEDAQGDRDAKLVSLDPSGNQVWNSGLNTDSIEFISDVIHSSNGDIVVIGGTRISGPPVAFFMAGFNTSGVFQWQETHSNSSAWVASRVVEDGNNGYWVATFNSSFGNGGSEGYLMNTGITGWYISGPTHGGSQDDKFYGLTRSLDSGIVVVGYSESVGPGTRAGMILKLDSAGGPSNSSLNPITDVVSVLPITPEIVELELPTVFLADQSIDIPARWKARDWQIIDGFGRTVSAGVGKSVALNTLRNGTYWLRLNRLEQMVYHRFVLIR